MSTNKAKYIAQAQKFQAKGQFDKAVAEYLKVVQAEPQDIRTWLKIGDLYTRMGARKEASDTYLKVAEQYTKQGFHLKAVAVFKQVLKIDPSLVEIHGLLADSYLRLGLTQDALTNLEQAVEILTRLGKNDALIQVTGRLIELEPANLSHRLRRAELYSRENRTAEAAAEFALAADTLKAAGRIEDYLKVAERLLHHAPDRHDVTKEVSSFYLEQGHYKRALAKLQVCFKADPHDLTTLELLARTFRGLEQPEKAVSVYKEVARLLGEQGRDEERRIIFETMLEIDPGNEAALNGLGRARPVPVAPPRPAPVAAPAPAPEPESFSEAEVEEKVAKIISEADVLLKYRLRDRAVEHLLKVFELDPFHIEAREKLREVYESMGRIEDAAEQLFVLAEAFRDVQPEGSVYYLHEILRMDPRNQRARRFLVDIGGVLPEGLAEEPLAGGLSEASESIDVSLSMLPDEPITQVGPAPEADLLAGELELEAEEVRLTDARHEVSISDEVSLAEQDDGLGGLPFTRSARELDESDFLGDAESGLELAAVTVPPPAEEGGEFDLDVASRGAGTFDLSDEDRAMLGAYGRPTPAPVVPPALPLDDDDAELSIVDEPDDEILDGADFLSEQRRSRPAPAPRRVSSLPPLPRPASLAPPPRAGAPVSPRLSGLPPAPLPVRQPLPSRAPTPLPTPAGAPTPAPAAVVAPATPLKRDPRSESTRLPVRPQVAKPIPVAPADPPAAPAADGEIAESLEELGFFIEQELWEEAEGLLADLITRHGAHPEVAAAKARLAAAKAPPAPEPVTVAPPAAPVDDEPFSLGDLAADFEGIEELTSDLGVNELESVLSQFRAGVEQQIASTDYSTHYDLGIAYKEMGLFDDAMNEFRIAAADPQRRVQCQTMLGLCLAGLGRNDEALAMFQEGLAGAPTPAERHGLLYEIGRTHEALGNVEEALGAYERVALEDPAFADVRSRATNLRGDPGLAGQPRVF